MLSVMCSNRHFFIGEIVFLKEVLAVDFYFLSDKPVNCHSVFC